MLSFSPNCPHAAALRNCSLDAQLDKDRATDVQCGVCERRGPGMMWLCLDPRCFTFLCALPDANHSLLHYQREVTHCLHLNLSSLQVWCYQCNEEVSSHLHYLALDREGETRAQEYDRRPKGVTGLQNVGNTCYMNAALQALSNTPPLAQHFLGRRPPAIGQASHARPLTSAFHRLLHDIWSERRPPCVAPTSVLYGIRTSHPMFRGFHQHDSQEFLRCLMDQLHEEMKTPDTSQSTLDYTPLSCLDSGLEGGTASSQSEGEEYETCDSGVSERSSLSEEPPTRTSKSVSRSPSPPEERRRLKTASIKVSPRMSQHGSPRRRHISYRSVISDVFDGKLISSVQCLTCNRVSTRVETFQDLSLPIPSRDHLTMLHQGSLNTSPNKCSHLYSNDQGWWWWLWDWVCSWFWGPTVGLHDCLAAFFSADELKGDNMYSCEKCRKLRNGVKYSRVLQCPEVLCIHLKRFRHELMFSSKIANYVTFPLQGLDLRPYLHANCPSEVTSYDLVSVICHHGIAGGGGHYTCYALNVHNQTWYEFDDQSVRQVSADVVKNCEAYVLFYRKDWSEVEHLRKKAWRLEEMCGGGGDSISYHLARDWAERFNWWGEPGRVDNSRLVCPHGRLAPSERPLALPQPVWAFLLSKFGGGPELRVDEYPPCELCSDQSELGLLAVQWLEFRRLQSCSDGRSYAILTSWLSTWESYVKGQSLTPPPPIDNTLLGTQDSGEEISEVTSGQWEMLVKLYGGGPRLSIRDSSDSDSRSLDERLSSCDNLDSGLWLSNHLVQGCENETETSGELVEVQTSSPEGS